MKLLRRHKRNNVIALILCIEICSLFYYHSTEKCIISEYINRYANDVNEEISDYNETDNNKLSDAISDRNYASIKDIFAADSFNRTSIDVKNYKEINVKDNIYRNLNLIIAGINDTVQNIDTVSFMLAIILMSFVSFLIALLKYIQKMDGKKRIVTFIR